MAGFNLRERRKHGFVSRQILAEGAVVAAARAEPLAVGPAAGGGQKGAAFFDFMFPELRAKPLDASEQQLAELAKAMREPAGVAEAELDNPDIPAGFTYLGQFVDHDMTLDLTPLAKAMDDPQMVKNFRTPGLDLDCVYGAGPGPHRFLFARRANASGQMVDTPSLSIGIAQESVDNVDRPGKRIRQLPNDLPRTAQGVALIGDHRNDENLVVAQIHLAFLKFHNAVVDHLAGTVPADQLFERAAKTVRWHYQWMILHDWVERLTERGIVARILAEGRKFYHFGDQPFMPWEFSAAAYRGGHSMVRETYSHNRVFRSRPPRIAGADLSTLFSFTNLSGNLVNGNGPHEDFGQGSLPSNWAIDWRRFFDLAPPADRSQFEFNPSRRLDTGLVEALHRLPGAEPGTPVASLAFRNLRRGVQLGLPSGQDVAALMRAQITFEPLSSDEVASGADGAVAQALGLHQATPLWFYILKEAAVRGEGRRLGPVGARIVAETFIGIVDGDKGSYLSDPTWKPHLPSAVPGTFFMTDLLKFVSASEDITNPLNGLNPVGD